MATSVAGLSGSVVLANVQQSLMPPHARKSAGPSNGSSFLRGGGDGHFISIRWTSAHYSCRIHRSARPVVSARAAAPIGDPESAKLAKGAMSRLLRASVLRPDGSSVTVGQLWNVNAGEIVVFALLRHLGCPFCWELASELAALKPEIAKAGAKLVVFSPGTPEGASKFVKQVPFPAENFFVDPERRLYEVLQLYSGVSRTLLQPSTVKALQSRGLGGIQKVMTKYESITPPKTTDVLQQGGMFVFQGKQVLFAHRDKGTADHARLKDVMLTCCGEEAAQAAVRI